MTNAAILEQYRPALTGHCYRMLGSVVDAEDAVQDAFLHAFRAMDRFQPDQPTGAIRVVRVVHRHLCATLALDDDAEHLSRADRESVPDPDSRQQGLLEVHAGHRGRAAGAGRDSRSVEFGAPPPRGHSPGAGTGSSIQFQLWWL